MADWLRRLRHAWRVWRSGLARSGLAGTERFSAEAYLAANRDVAAAGVDPLLHYLLDGWAGGRPLRPGPHPPLDLPLASVLGLSERVARAMRGIRPRCRVLRPEPGPDPAATIAVRPERGAMPTGWCLIRARGAPATLLVRTGGVVFDLEIPAGGVLVRLPEIPAQLALRRAGRQARPVVTVCELGELARRRVLRRGVAMGVLEDATSYEAWVRRYDTPTPAQTAAMAARAARLVPRFSVTPAGRLGADAMAALDAQVFTNWELCGDAAEATGDFIVRLEADSVLAPYALLLAAEAIAAHPGCSAVYGDEDRLIDGRRADPWFKPDASPDLAGGLVISRRGASGDGGTVVHIPHVLVHRAGERGALPGSMTIPAPMRWPTVTAIVPTRDQAGVLAACLEGLLAADYPALDIIVADNDSTEPATLALLARMGARGVTVLPCPGPFNYSAINNRAAAAARGEMLLFLNNDIAMEDPGWLREMAALAIQPSVGAVGAKLLYPDGTLQHGGVVLGMGGIAGHVHLGAAGDDPGYFGCLSRIREVSAVTAACMMVPAARFAEVGGFHAAGLAVAFNDIDLCLRLRAAGFRALWTPHAVLRHWESKSRGSDLSPERLEKFSAEIDVMRARWGDALDADPFFSPNLSLDTTDPAPAFPPRAPRPWE